MATRSLQKVDHLPDRCFTRWRLEDGSLVDQEITEAQYLALQKGEDAQLVAPARNATQDLGKGTGLAWSSVRVTGDVKPFPGCLYELRSGTGYFNTTVPEETFVLVTSSGSQELFRADFTGDPDVPATITVTRELRNAQVIDGQLIEP